MTNTKWIAAALAAVCAMGASAAPTGNAGSRPVNMPNEHYACRTGQGVTVQYVGNSRIALSLDTDRKARAVLAQTRAASGELYTSGKGLYGKYTEWHQKNGEAAFEFRDRYGNKTQTVCHKKRRR